MADTTITQLRNYRIKFESPYFNDKRDGVAIFDLVGTFLAAYVIEMILYKVFDVQVNRKIYYTMLIPLGIIVHKLLHIDTFLNNQLFSPYFNIYKAIIIVNLVLLAFYLFKNS